MATITIDGQVCEFDGKASILQVALDNGFEIPHYCYHPGMSVVASCRICLAEIAQPNPRNDNKLELVPKLVPTCQTPAVDGMQVYTKSPKSIANQKAVMEYLLVHHPLDCPVCDQAGECYLQDYSFKYGRGKSRFAEAKIKQPKKNLGQYVMLYADRCIMCTRCVRFTREISGTAELGVFGRGNREQIDIFPGKSLDNELSGNVIDICPVGALLDKDFLMSMRVWDLDKASSIDGLTASGDNISIEYNENEGKVYRVKPRTNMDVNKWWISDEIRYGWKHIHHQDRLRSPLTKVHGSHEECDWNQAYSQATRRLQQIVTEHGPGSLAIMVSPMLAAEEAYLLAKLARAIDDKALLAVGPVPFAGQDKRFPGGYTIYAEKAPNARGVRRALELVADGDVLDADTLLARLKDGSVRAVIATGNYPSTWATAELAAALAEPYTLLIDTLPSDLFDQVELVLPGATWAEKAGTFENVHNRLQSFNQAIPVIELAKTEGQIALDLLAWLGQRDNQRYDARRIRSEMGGVFVTDVHHPPISLKQVSDMQYVEL